MNTIQQIEIRKVRDFGEIISVTFEFIRKHFKNLMRIMFIIPGPIFILGGIIMSIYSYRIGRLAQSNPDPGSFFLGVIGIFIIAAIILGIGYLMLLLSINEYIVLNLKKGSDEITLRELWGNIKRSFWNYLGGGIVIGIIVGVGSLFLIIPGIYLSIALIFVMIAISTEKKMFGDAIARSFYLIKGNWWSTFGLMVVLAIMQLLITYTLMLPFYAVNWISALFVDSMFMIDSDFYLIYSVVVGILFYTLAMVVSTIPYIAIVFKYFSIVEEKDEVGMQERIMQMGMPETE